ncbi:MAG: response regulator [candidate division Zixibacteria bacterium]|nr:response regulator [candidate division Zixibacteria bacterium]
MTMTTETPSILIVDDDARVLRTLELLFSEDYTVYTAGSGEEALDVVRAHPELCCVVLDIRMAKMDGLETATKMSEINSDVPIIFHTGYPGDYSESAIDEEHQPFDYVEKGERPERLRRSVRNAVELTLNRRNPRRLASLAKEQYEMIGSSPVMCELYECVEQLAPTENKIMILGPTGSGKELVARAIHARSRRADKRFVVFNCNHKDSALVESELYGHVQGAFTDAKSGRVGLFEYADGGTVFLDEIGDLDMTTQAKLLRVLESGEFSRVGSPEVKACNVRVLCATHRDLQQLVQNQTFREDLYFRLRGVTVNVPSLTERREDIPDLIHYFVEVICTEEGAGLKVFNDAAIDAMTQHEWPGNVRDLATRVAELIATTPSWLITAEDVNRVLSRKHEQGPRQQSLREMVRTFQRIKINEALKTTNRNIAAAARLLDVDRANLKRMMDNLGIDPS